LTETTGGISLSTKKDLSVATVGQTLPCVKIKLKDWAEGDYLVHGKNDTGPCGEILIGGPMVASGKDLFRYGRNTSPSPTFS
jgi:long-subunit acyl-CoA synthetase (AMP-forming)